MSKAEEVGLSSERLKRIDEFLKTKYVDSGKLAGMVVQVARKGETVHSTAIGEMDRERGKPMREDTIFRIYSMTKPLTSLAFMMLVEEGKVALDDPVHRFIPAWRNLGVFAAGTVDSGFQTTPLKRPMRMIDLLRHTSGLTYGFQMRTNVDAAYRQLGIGVIEAKEPPNLDRMVELLADVPLEFSPGEAWNYSVSTDILGYLIGKISGVPFREFLKTRIIEPLGMVDTDFHVPADKAERFAACYALNPKGEVVLQDDPAKSQYLGGIDFVSGGGGLVGTASDYMKFCQMLLRGGEAGGHRFVSPRTLDLMTLNHLPGGRELMELSRSLFSEAGNEGLGFGLGFAMVLDQAKAMTLGNEGEYFWGGAASTAFWIDPWDEIAVVFMTQLIPSSAYPIRKELRTLVYSSVMED